MKGRRSMKVPLLALLILIIIVGMIAWEISTRFLLFLPHENLIYSCYSPQKNYLVEFYHNRGNATVADSVTGDVTDMKSKKKRTFYFCYREDEAEVKWLDDSQCVVNGSVIDLQTDVYDSRDMYKQRGFR